MKIRELLNTIVNFLKIHELMEKNNDAKIIGNILGYIRILKSRQKLLIGVLLFIIGFYQTFNIVFIDNQFQSSLFGIDLYYTNDNQSLSNVYRGYSLRDDNYTFLDFINASQISSEYSGIITLEPLMKQKSIRVQIDVVKNDSINEYPNFLIVFFPGSTANYTMHPAITSYDFWRTGITNPSIDISKDIEVFEHPLFKSDLNVIKIDTYKITNFSGNIEFIWVDGLKEVDFLKYKVSLSFGAPTPGKNFIKISKYKLNLNIPSVYKLDNSEPQYIGIRNLFYTRFYSFEIDNINSEFFAEFSDTKGEQYKNFYLIIYSLILGAGLTLILEDLLLKNSDLD